jgi:hypothetical protein
MPRKKTSKRKARGILKRKSNHTSKNPGSSLRDTKIPAPKRQLHDDYESRKKRAKRLITQIDDEQSKSIEKQDQEKLDSLYVRLDELSKPSRGAFQEGLFYHGPNLFMHGEELTKATQRAKDRYRANVIEVANAQRSPDNSIMLPTIRWEDENSPPQPQVRTWGQFALQTLGLGKGKGTKKQGKKRKAKGKAKGKSKSKAKS